MVSVTKSAACRALPKFLVQKGSSLCGHHDGVVDSTVTMAISGPPMHRPWLSWRPMSCRDSVTLLIRRTVVPHVKMLAKWFLRASSIVLA